MGAALRSGHIGEGAATDELYLQWSMKTSSWKLTAGGALLLALGGGAAWWWAQGRAPEVSYRTGKIERGTLQATVSASGTVTPVTQVVVGTQVSGQIKELYVDFNSEVKAGQLIATIDPETFEYRVRQAQADVDASQAAVLTAQANAAASRAAVSRARVEHTEAQRDYERKKSLVDRQFIAQTEADKALALVNTTRESLASADAQAGVTEAQIKSAQANVQQRLAALAQARVDLARTRILSPVNGIVIKRAIEKGQTVAASLQAPELFVIAQNLQDMQVEASVDESDVSRIRLGQRATFTVDAFPGQTFEAEVRQVRKAAQTVANVVTYVAVLGFSNAGGRLLPGMTANVRVVTDVRENVLKVPNAALRVRIAGVEPAAAPGSAASGPVKTGWSLLPSAHAQGAPGGGIPSMKERLVRELALTSQQQAKFDAIAGELRPKFMALRELPEGERREAREKLVADMRARIEAMLSAEQKAKYAQLQAQAAQGTAAAAAPAASAPEAAAAAPVPAAPPAAAKAPPPQRSAPAPDPGAAPPSAGNPFADFRNRLVTELQLDAAQKEKVDAIYADARPKFMQLRELPAEERGKARDRIRADVRARIADLLTPQQKARYQTILAEVAGRGVTRGRIYLLGEDGKPRAFNVRLGITDGTMTELLPAPADAAELKEGAAVITGIVTQASAPPRPSSPRMGF
jgi:HlyD family secretion protein